MLKPGTTWDFSPAQDEFNTAALFDLRSMNEKVAGEHGFIKLSKDGNSFVRGDGTPIRFWGGTDYAQGYAFRKGGGEMTELEHHARFLAKRGVNVVRFHGDLAARKEAADITQVNERSLESSFRLVAAMKKQGIYTVVSPYWSQQAPLNDAWGVSDPGNGKMTALVFFEPTVQKGYKAWLKELVTRPNPYTGVALKDEPAVAMIQLQNEDSILFSSMHSVKGEAAKLLRRQYGQFLGKKYGDLKKAQDAWKGCVHPDDAEGIAQGMPGMFIVWEFSRDARAKKGSDPGREQRLADQLEFMTGVMGEFNAEMAKYLRDELGCKQLINAGNWKTVDPVVVDDAERYSYTANEVIAKNHYFTGEHKGAQSGYRISEGHTFTNLSATRQPLRLPMNVKQVDRHPFIISESLWVPPDLYQSEGPLMVAAQSCLTGLDTFYWFCNGVTEWQPPGNKWTFSTPMQLGQFPAAALIFRNGLVEEGEPVVHEQRSLRSLWGRKIPIIAESASYDPNRDREAPGSESGVTTRVDPLAFLVGPIRVTYGGDPARTKVGDLSKYIDRGAQRVRSVTGQIEFDMKGGLYTVNAPKAQAVAGFLSRAGEVRLKDVRITCGNEYATIVAVPLDDQPISQSRKVLVQVGTVCRATGFSAEPTQDGGTETVFRITDPGKAPWQVEKAVGTVVIGNAHLKRATVLDPNGMPTGAPLSIERRGKELTLQLPQDALYVVLSAD